MEPKEPIDEPRRSKDRAIPDHGIVIEVDARYVAENSSPRARHWFFAYEITIRNVGIVAARLMTRHWLITDANGKVEEVRGEGVVGETPHLNPGESFTYTSFCPLGTEFGSMRGSYEMIRPDGVTFEAEIPPFVLAVPTAIN